MSLEKFGKFGGEDLENLSIFQNGAQIISSLSLATASTAVVLTR
jgi:hypothetical protein